MNYVETLQTQSKEDATKAIFTALNNKAIEVVSSVQEQKDNKETEK